MKMKVKKIIALLLCIMLMMQFTACGDDSECKKVVEKFETACNENDLDGILDCITPTISSPIKMAIGVAGFLSDVDLSDTFTELLAQLMGTAGNNIDAAALFGSMELNITKTEKDSKERLVYVDITYEILGEPLKSHGVFRMEEKDKEWYIKSFRFVDED